MIETLLVLQLHQVLVEESFNRSGIKGGNFDAYSRNYAIDDVSEQFNGSKKVFTLQSNKTKSNWYCHKPWYFNDKWNTTGCW